MDLRSRMNEVMKTSLPTKAVVEKVVTTRTLTLDGTVSEAVKVKQGDHNSRVLQLTLYKSSRQLLDLTGSEVYLFVKKNGEVVKLQGDTVTGSTGVVEFILTKEALSTVGTVKCEVVRVGMDKSTLSFPIFEIRIEESIYKGVMVYDDSDFSVIDDVVPITEI